MRLLGPARRRDTRRRQSGWSLVEVTIVAALLTVIALQALTVTRSSEGSASQLTQDVLLEDRAQLVLERIARAVMGSSRESLAPTSARPLSTSEIEYRIYLGVEDGEVVWGDTERIELDDLDSAVVWRRLPLDGSDPVQVVWTDLARPYLEGELPNGMDDNGNGLIDERGLSFHVDRDAVTIQLTLGQLDDSGTLRSTTVQTTVMCRNPSEAETN